MNNKLKINTLTKTCKLLILLLIGFFTGCWGGYGASVTGSVTLDGEPIGDTAMGTVTFIPDGGGPPAVGAIRPGSRYVLSTGRESSLIPGDYSVTVGISERPTSKYGPNGGPPPPGKIISPPKYRRKKTSGLHFTVEPGSNTINLELQSKG